MAEWYYAIGNERKGPVSSESIVAFIKNGEISPNTLVWRQGIENWIPFTQSELSKSVTLSPPPPPKVPASQKSTSGTIFDIVSSFSVRCKDSKIFFAPNIPANKLSNALLAFANGVDPNEVCLLVDDTVFGNSKDGFIITQTHLYCKGLNALEGKSVDISNIRSVALTHGTIFSDLFINDNKFCSFSQSDKANREIVAQIIQALIGKVPPNHKTNVPLSIDQAPKYTDAQPDAVVSEHSFNKNGNLRQMWNEFWIRTILWHKMSTHSRRNVHFKFFN